MSVTMDMSCNILDDDELEKVASMKPRPMELRQWISQATPKENPFEKGFIKPSYSFPKAFQNKTQSDEFPPLISRAVLRPATSSSTTTLLMRVKEKLEKNPVSEIVSQPKEEIKTPPYGLCTPDLVSHTPPYPPE